MSAPAPKPGHGDHWRAVLGEDEGRLTNVLEFPVDAPEGVKLHRHELTPIADLVQITARRRLITAYPEPRATTLVRLRPRELLLWDTRVEGWLVAEHATVGTLTLFLTDLVENAKRYDAMRGEVALEVGALAYTLQRPPAVTTPARMLPGTRIDARSLPDDFWIEGDVRAIRGAAASEVLDVEVHGGLTLPVGFPRPAGIPIGARAHGLVWLTARWPEGQEEQGS